MKVKVTYGCELASVPTMVKGMLNEVEKVIEAQLQRIKIIQSMIEAEEFQPIAPASIDSVRKALTSADQSLADGQSILQGYVDVQVAGETATRQPTPTPEATDG